MRFIPVIILAFSLVSTVAADEALSPAQAFDKTYSGWKQLQEKARGLIQSFRTSTPDRQQEIRTELVGLQKQAEPMMAELEKHAVAAYKAAPNKSKDVVEVMVGVTGTKLAMDQNKQAYDLIKLLVDNKAVHPQLNSVAGKAAYCNEEFEAAEKYLQAAAKTSSLEREAAGYLGSMAKTKKLWGEEMAARKADAETDDLPRVKMETDKGTLVIELFENEAPQAVANFISLVEKEYYNGLTFHRVIPGFMAQGGCPDGTGRGGPGYQIYCECHGETYRGHFTGTLSMAHKGRRNTGGSQFFLTFRPTPHLNGEHTAFGRVIEGMDILPQLERVDPDSPNPNLKPSKMIKVTVIRKRDHEYKPTKVDLSDIRK